MRTFKDLIQEQKSYEPLPNGWYLCALDSVSLKKGATSGLDYIGLAFRIKSGRYQNRVIFLNIFPYTKDGEVNTISINTLAQAVTAMLGTPASETDIFNTDKVDELADNLRKLVGKRLGVFTKLRERISNGKTLQDSQPVSFRTEEVYLREFAGEEDVEIEDEEEDEIPF